MHSVLKAFRFTQQYAEMLLADITEEEMTSIPHPGMNHPAWILGHLTLGAGLAAQLLGGELTTDEAWMEKFGPGSTPISDRSAYPTKAELIEKLTEAYTKADERVSQATEGQLSAPNETPFFQEQFPTIEDLLTHLLTTHASMHLGQLSAWRRCLGKGSVLGI